MASVKQRGGKGPWYACITIERDGVRKQTQFSTGLMDRDEALAVAVAAERAARRHQEAPHQLRIALDKLAEDYMPEVSTNPKSWLTAWSKRVAPTVEDTTAKAYEDVAKEAGDWMQDNGVWSFLALTTAKLEAMRGHWLEIGNSPVTANSKMKRLAVALEAARREKLMPENPTKNLERLRESKTVRREVRPTELTTLLNSLSGEWRALALLGIYTGQRFGDLAELTWSHVDLQAGTISFTARKTDSLVSLPLVQSVLDALLALPTADNVKAKVFPAIAKMSKQSRSNAFREILANVGLATPINRKEKVGGRKKRRTSELSFHSLRHSATSMLKAAGVSDAIARAIIGHESAAVSRVYTHIDIETMRAALEKMPQV